MSSLEFPSWESFKSATKQLTSSLKASGVNVKETRIAPAFAELFKKSSGEPHNINSLKAELDSTYTGNPAAEIQIRSIKDQFPDFLNTLKLMQAELEKPAKGGAEQKIFKTQNTLSKIIPFLEEALIENLTGTLRVGASKHEFDVTEYFKNLHVVLFHNLIQSDFRYVPEDTDRYRIINELILNSGAEQSAIMEFTSHGERLEIAELTFNPRLVKAWVRKNRPELASMLFTTKPYYCRIHSACGAIGKFIFGFDDGKFYSSEATWDQDPEEHTTHVTIDSSETEGTEQNLFQLTGNEWRELDNHSAFQKFAEILATDFDKTKPFVNRLLSTASIIEKAKKIDW